MGQHPGKQALLPLVRPSTAVIQYPAANLEGIRAHWVPRVLKLGKYVTGRKAWMDLDLNSLEVQACLEQKEKSFSADVLEVFDKIFPPFPAPKTMVSKGQPFKMLVVGCGPGRRITHYIDRARNYGGSCVGVDALVECLKLLYAELEQDGLQQYRTNFTQGLATHLTTIYSERSMDCVTWERLGNHILDDDAWEFALGHEVTQLLKTGGTFMLAESLAELNPGRIFDPESSRPRTLEDYKRILAPHLQYRPELERHTVFDGDNYLIGCWKKAHRGRH